MSSFVHAACYPLADLPTLVQGFGTAFIGQRDFWPDGSYIATEWFVFCCVPVYPLRSVRIIRGRETGTMFEQTTPLKILAEFAPHRRQVVSIYLFTVCYIAFEVPALFWFIGFANALFEPGISWAGVVGASGIVGLPWLLPRLLRKRARNRDAMFK